MVPKWLQAKHGWKKDMIEMTKLDITEQPNSKNRWPDPGTGCQICNKTGLDKICGLCRCFECQEKDTCKKEICLEETHPCKSCKQYGTRSLEWIPIFVSTCHGSDLSEDFWQHLKKTQICPYKEMDDFKE